MMKAKEDMSEKPSLEDMLKCKLCYGTESDLKSRAMAAKEACGCNDMDGEENDMDMEDIEDMEGMNR